MHNVWSNERFMVDKILVTPESARTENFLKYSGLGLDSLAVARNPEHGMDWDKTGIDDTVVDRCVEDHVNGWTLRYSRPEW